MQDNEDIMQSYAFKSNTEHCISQIAKMFDEHDLSFNVTHDNEIQISNWNKINQQKHRGICNFIVRCAKQHNVISHIIPNEQYTTVNIHFTRA